MSTPRFSEVVVILARSISALALWGIVVSPAQVVAQQADLLAFCTKPETPPEDAIGYCRGALNGGDLDPQTAARVRANLGLAYSATGRSAAAMQAFAEALEDDPALIAVHVYRAREFEERGNLGAAMSEFTAALNKAPGSAEVRAERGAMSLRDGNAEGALVDLDRVVRMRSGWTNVRFNRGLARLDLGDFAGADEDFTRILSERPDDAGSLLNRAVARGNLGLASARADYDAALALRPEWAAAYFARGRYLDRSGQVEDANRDFLRARDLGYRDPWLEERVRAISR